MFGLRLENLSVMVAPSQPPAQALGNAGSGGGTGSRRAAFKLPPDFPHDRVTVTTSPLLPGVPGVIRSNEERMANPERLNLDDLGFERCPVLENEYGLRMLTLQVSERVMAANPWPTASSALASAHAGQLLGHGCQPMTNCEPLTGVVLANFCPLLPTAVGIRTTAHRRSVIAGKPLATVARPRPTADRLCRCYSQLSLCIAVAVSQLHAPPIPQRVCC
jgi:hypothetical protein